MCREIYVVTKVPTWPASSNLSHDHIYMAETDRDKYTFYVLDDWSSIDSAKEHRAIEFPVKREIFHLGEVIVCDGAGREVGGFQRMPYKWGWIKSDDPDDDHHKNTGLWFEEFDNLGDALKCAHEVLRERIQPPAEEPECVVNKGPHLFIATRHSSIKKCECGAEEPDTGCALSDAMGGEEPLIDLTARLEREGLMKDYRVRIPHGDVTKKPEKEGEIQIPSPYAKCPECGSVHDASMSKCPNCGASMKGDNL